MIELVNLSKTFVNREGSVEALRNINITVGDGDVYGIIGMSGAGKSTLVRCINMIERPSAGRVIIDGVDLGTLSRKELRAVRRRVAMIFQSFNLLEQRSCLGNICFPLALAGVGRDAAEARARGLLEMVGLPDKADAYPSQLSGGQKQRVAIARALATRPKVLLCDEATSALDPRTTGQILELIADINKRLGITVVVITHQMSVVESICNKVAILDGGEIVEKGSTAEIFAHPGTEAAKRLVFPGRAEGARVYDEASCVISLSFSNAEATDRPLIAELASEKHIAASIIAASTRSVGGRLFGKMLLKIADDPLKIRTALDYFSSVRGVTAERVTREQLSSGTYDIGEDVQNELAD